MAARGAGRAGQRRSTVLRDLGVQAWTLRSGRDGCDPPAWQPTAPPTSALPQIPVPPVAPAPPSGVSVPPCGEGWDALESRALACTACALHRTRQRVVFGVGARQARWFVVGEAPGADEDRQGEPFVGRAGQLLNEMLHAAGASRDSVYIGNILKCRPPDNRDPRPDEVTECIGYLRRQIALVAPGLILAVGRVAAQNLLGVDTPIGRLRGHVHRYGEAGVPVVVTYHPAYLLRSPGQKARAWDDLCLARSVITPT